jgi:DUF1680 family protein
LARAVRFLRALGCALLMSHPGSSPAAGSAVTRPQLKPLPVRSVHIADTFWAPKLETCRRASIPHSWFYMQWNLRALRCAAGEAVEGDLNGTWDEANLFKFIETAAHALGVEPDPDLERRIDDVIALVGRAQRKDGYAHAYVIHAGKPPWDPAFLDGSHDGYVLGHLIEAAIEYHANTGKRALLDIACRAADQAWDHFLGPNGRPGFCGHAELEMALVELHRVTGQRRYLDLARAFVEWRGRGKVQPAGDTPRAYFQDAAPLRQQKTLEGHAVRAVFFATGVADLALETGNPDYRDAARRFWESTARRRMNIAGGIGPRAEHEAFGEDYELPDDGYYESCAACGLADFAHRMFLLERAAEPADVLERVLYNAVLHGLELTGTNSYYQNPLTDRDRPRYNSWVCCPPNLTRTLFQVGRYAYAFAPRDIYVNLYVGGTATFPLQAGPVSLRVQTEYPWDGAVRIAVEPKRPARFVLRLRWPGWCRDLQMRLNGQPVPSAIRGEDGYILLDRQWRPGDRVEMEMAMGVERVVAHPNVRGCVGKVAVQRGPLLYGFEGLDQPARTGPQLGADPRFEVQRHDDLLGGIRVIRGQGADGGEFVAIPFHVLANRAKSTQEVWVPQRGMTANSQWWLGELYRPLQPADLAPPTRH